jgi:hypothetical protein
MVDFTFRDATGILWKRDYLGQLSEVIENQDVA